MRVADEIMSNYQHVVTGLTLIPGRAGVFDVVVEQTTGQVDDGSASGDTPVNERIYSKKQTGRQARPGEVLEALEVLLPEGTLRYGT